MNFQELKDKLFGKVKGDGVQVHFRDGRTSGYRPYQKKNREELIRETMPQESAQIPYIHTGFTNMNPPQDGRGYTSNEAYGNTGYTGWGPGNPQDSSRGYNTGYTNEERNAHRDNISYMPGAGKPETPVINRTHRIMTLTGLRNCYDAIDCMKNGETLILTLDAIGNEGEITRCKDMLAGAAFTLGCTVRSLPAPRMIMVVPAGVQVYPEEQRYTGYAPASSPIAPMEPAMPAVSETPAPRQRRVSQNTQNWRTVAATGTDNAGGYMQPQQSTVRPNEYPGYGGYGY